LDPACLPASPDFYFEQVLWQAGISQVAGIDEAGRGALAGPVAAAAVIFPGDASVSLCLNGVRDSKQMTPEQRKYWAGPIRMKAIAWSLGMASAQEIDSFGILAATRLAIQRALEALPALPEHLLLDYIFLPESTIPQTALIKGDCRSLSIAAASILAKTARDELMVDLDQRYPGYGFAVHKGYGTRMHRQAIEHLGISPLHRLTFQPMRGYDEKGLPGIKVPPAVLQGL
jgi:ribonuclease HII